MTTFRRAVTAAVTVTLIVMMAVSDDRGPVPARHIPPLGFPAAPHPMTIPPATNGVDGFSHPRADPVYPDFGNPNIDVLKYDITLSWLPSTTILTGTATLTIRMVHALDIVALDFSPAYTIERANLNGSQVTTRWHNGDLVIPLGHPMATDSTVTVTIDYRGIPREGPFPGKRSDITSTGIHIDAERAIWAVQEPYGAYTWFPCSDHPSDKALVDITIHAPTGWSGVSSGMLVELLRRPDGSTTSRWKGTEPSATYLIALAIGRFVSVTASGPRGLPITYWVLPEHAERMLPLLRRTPQLLDWLERRFGPYPFSSAGIVVVPYNAAMETQTMVTMGTLSGSRGESVLLHELAHQWFGNAVSPSTWIDLWLNEGFATYIELLYSVDTMDVSLDTTIQRWKDLDRKARSVAGPPGKYLPDHFADQNVYIGPALMLHTLRLRLKDPLFFAMCRDWAQHHRYISTDRETFIRWITNYTGIDLSRLITEWLDSPTTPQAQ